MSLTRLKPTGVNSTAQFSMANLSVQGNVAAGNLKTDNLLYANGVAWDLQQAAGASSQIQFNTNNNFDASANLSFNKSTKTLTTDTLAGNVTGNLTGTVLTASQPQITTVGTLTSISVSGDATISGNLTVSGTTTTINSTVIEVADTALVLARNATTPLQANGAGIIINGAGANLTYNNVSNSLVSTHKISADGSLLSALTGANVTGRVPLATSANVVSNAAQPAITSVGTLTGLTVSGEIVTQYLTATSITGTLSVDSNSQPNITSVGSLLNLDVTGNITASGNATFTGNISGNKVTASGNIVGSSKLFIGTGSSSLTNPVAVFQGSGATFDQIALYNSIGTGSSDYVAYGDLGTDEQAWTDMGFAGSTFNDPNYTVTAPGDGYLFVQGNTSFGGNLVLATGNVGTTKDIIFATGGFKTANIKARLYNSNSALSVVGNVYGSNLVSAGQIQANVTTGTSPFIISSTTKVANLNADLLDGYNTDTAATASTVVVRDTNANITANNITGTLVTASQTNITTVGTLTDVTVSGNANVKNLTANTTISFTGNTNVSAWFTSAQTTEALNALGALSSATTNYNLATGASFYHSSITLGANWTANIQNVPTTDGRTVIVTIMVVQGTTPYIPNVVQIDGTPQTIKWASGITPVGRASAVDIFSFGLVRAGAAWAQVLGSYTSYS